MDKSKSHIEFVFKVNLKAARRIWRTIAMRGDQSLDDLHNVIFSAFDRFDPHLYSFYFPKAPRRQGVDGSRRDEYVSASSFRETRGAERTFDAASTRIDGLGLKIGQTFEYLFDYGDTWWHEVKVEQIGVADRARYPEITASHGRSPVQYADG